MGKQIHVLYQDVAYVTKTHRQSFCQCGLHLGFALRFKKVGEIGTWYAN